MRESISNSRMEFSRGMRVLLSDGPLYLIFAWNALNLEWDARVETQRSIGSAEVLSASSLILSSLELIDTKVYGP